MKMKGQKLRGVAKSADAQKISRCEAKIILVLDESFAETVKQLRNQIQCMICAKCDEIVFQVNFAQNTGAVKIVLNNSRDGSANLYIKQVTQLDGVVLYPNPKDKKEFKYIEYDGDQGKGEEKLPSFNINALNFNDVLKSLAGNYFTAVVPMIKKLCMIVESIRLKEVGNAIHNSLESYQDQLNFMQFKDDICGGWSRLSKEFAQNYIEQYEDVRKVDIIPALEANTLNLGVMGAAGILLLGSAGMSIAYNADFLGK